MYKKYGDILTEHEKKDEKVVRDNDEIERRIGLEFENSEELLRLYRSVPEAGIRFFAKNGRVYDDVIAVRKSDRFGIRKHTLSQRPYLHGHSFFEFIYVSRGKCVQQLIRPDRTIVLKEGQACLLSPGTVHEIERSEKNDIVLKMVLPRPLFEKIAPDDALSKQRDGITLYESVSRQTAFFILKILEEFSLKDDVSDCMIQNYLALVFLDLRRAERKYDDGVGARLRDYFETCLKSANLGDFAAIIGYSEGYAGHYVKEKLGGSFSEILVNYKMERAADFLNETERSVEDVAFELGYQNASGFYKQFQNFYGMTPKEFRKLYR